VFGVIEGTLLVVRVPRYWCVLGLPDRTPPVRRARLAVHRQPQSAGRQRRNGEHDLKVVMLTGLIPFFPSKISNYFFGQTKFTFKGYVLGSLIGFHSVFAAQCLPGLNRR
jgi:hypothetical protein